MPTTSRGYPYPQLDGDVTGNVPLDMKALADSLNADVGTQAARATALEGARTLAWEGAGIVWGNVNSPASPLSWSRRTATGPNGRTWHVQGRLVAPTNSGVSRWYLTGLPAPAMSGTILSGFHLVQPGPNISPYYAAWGWQPEALWYLYTPGLTDPQSAAISAGWEIHFNFTYELA